MDYQGRRAYPPPGHGRGQSRHSREPLSVGGLTPALPAKPEGLSAVEAAFIKTGGMPAMNNREPARLVPGARRPSLRVLLGAAALTLGAYALAGCATVPDQPRCVVGAPFDPKVAAWQGWLVHRIRDDLAANLLEGYRRPEAPPLVAIPDTLLILHRPDSPAAWVHEMAGGCVLRSTAVPAALAEIYTGRGQGRGS